MCYHSTSETEKQEETVAIAKLKAETVLREESMENISLNGYDGVVATRIRGLCECHPKTGDKTTYAALAAHLNVKNQSVSQWTRGETIPDTKHLAPIARYFGVSVDWLLGLSPIKRGDASVQSIHKATGLSEEAIKTLGKIKAYPVYGFSEHNLLLFINALLDDGGLYYELSESIEDIIQAIIAEKNAQGIADFRDRHQSRGENRKQYAAACWLYEDILRRIIHVVASREAERRTGGTPDGQH